MTDDSARDALVTYLPYGETLTEQHTTDEDLPTSLAPRNWTTSLAFTTMEPAVVTPCFANWLRVDLFEKYPDMSPYVLCGNPVKFIDPDGMDYYSSTDEKWQ